MESVPERPDRPSLPHESGSRLARNTLFNLLGQGVPLLGAFFAIPVLIHGLGTDRFGILTLAWMIIGYISLIDLGMSRALTQLVAEKLSEGDQTKAPPLVWRAMAVIFVLGLMGALLLSLLAPWLAQSLLKVPITLQLEALHSIYLLSAAVPVVVLTTVLIGILSAFQRFGVLNAIRVPLGLYTFAAPLAIIPYSQSLVPVIWILVLGRILALGAHVIACRDILPPLRSTPLAAAGSIKHLFQFGAWTTVTNVVGPLMLYLDRLVIGSFISVGAVAYYATPYEMVTRLLIIPNSVLGTLFPAFASSHRRDRDRMVLLFSRGTKYVALMLFPIVLAIVAFAEEGLRWWLGSEFAAQGTRVLQCLAIGVFINALAQVFATLIQGTGRPDLSAKIHLVELPLYLGLLWWAVRSYGLFGAAMAWTFRVTLDFFLLFWLSRRILGGQSAVPYRWTSGLLLPVAALVAPLFLVAPVSRTILVLLILILFVSVAWRRALAEDERAFIKLRLGSLRGR